MERQPRRAKPKPKPDDPRWIPRPPADLSSADFIVTVFAVTVATILLILTVGLVAAAIFSDTDIKAYFAILTSIVTSMISALVGYLAGKGQGRQDVTQENKP